MLQKKIIWKLNIIDLLLIIIIALSIAALIYKSVSGGDDSEYRNYDLTFVCESAPIGLFDTIDSDRLCIDGGTGEEIGELRDFEITPIVEYASQAAQQPTAEPDESEDENASEDEDADNEDAEDEENDKDERRSTPRPAPTPEPTRAKAVFNITSEAAKADHGIRINKNVYLLGQSMQLVIGDTVFDVYISNME